LDDQDDSYAALHQGRGLRVVTVRRRAFVVETDQLRPGVPILRVRGVLNRATITELRRAAERCLRMSPWALVIDLTGLLELRPAAVPTLAALADRAGRADIGLYFVTAGAPVDAVLEGGPDGDLFDIHHSFGSAERALSMRP
jgi:hypothetical protein